MHEAEWKFYGDPGKSRTKLTDIEKKQLFKGTMGIIDSLKRFFFVLIPDFIPLKLPRIDSDHYQFKGEELTE